jgi:hypothetical protein
MEVEDQDKKKTIVPNPAYLAWVSQDQTVLGFLVNSLSPEILAHVVDLETSAEIWSTITAMFTTTSRSKVQHLRGTLQNVKKNEMTLVDFFTKVKGYTSELVVIGKPVDEDELMWFILNGLDGSYNSLVSSVNANPSTRLDDLYDVMCSHEQRQAMLSETGQDTRDFHSSANVAHRGRLDDRDCHPW